MENQEVTLEKLNAWRKGTMVEHLDIQLTEVGPDFLCGKMPVDHRTRQPMGLLHGGASLALAETLGSLGANLHIDLATQACVGLEINANHLKSVRDGYVYGRATALHIGRSTQVWEIRISSETGDLVCVSRITMAVIQKKQ